MYKSLTLSICGGIMLVSTSFAAEKETLPINNLRPPVINHLPIKLPDSCKEKDQNPCNNSQQEDEIDLWGSWSWEEETSSDSNDG